ncbi:hypothetical protein, partial [Neisseria meningitidis]|uniref:hypothetical protein n=1 Tax=Neisseria meningitidis TaxID=487 RepID=UPI0039898E3E
KVFWGIGVIRRFRFSVGLGKMDNIDGVGGIGGNGGIGGLKPTLQPALCPRCTSYARLAFLISSILRNTLRPLKKFQTVFFIKCEKYNVIPAQAGI